ncbi:hypothetical protein FE634_14705 [Nocardioides dongxiaopingii]|uniref:DMT family transporter n=1 Tax=Nocardioides TaxID=1839 RepID=UPI001165C316|nr:MULTISPECIES: DMT family transporter [Nocardioides]QCW51343.2 hypothetical protein FE634_14705 [Nocardioides sp. S-1144]
MLLGVVLALGSSVTHAAWNTSIKRVAADGLAVLWAYSLAGLGVVVVVLGVRATTVPIDVTPELVAWSAVSTVLHTGYAAALQRAYRDHDVSVVYPLSRGAAPVLVALVAWPLLGQRLSWSSWLGLLLMCLAVAALVGETGEHTRLSWRPALWGLGIGVAVASYTTFDGWVVVSRGADPLTYYTLGAVLQLALVTVLLRGRVGRGLAQVRRHPRPVAVLAVLIPTSYVLGLHATQHAPVSLVAAVRSSSLVWTALAAAVVLRERVSARRLLSTGLATASIVAMVAAR